MLFLLHLMHSIIKFFLILYLELPLRPEIKSRIDVLILGGVVCHCLQRAGQIHIKLMGISAERLNCNSDPDS
jgi:hypothetical protein